MQTVFQDVTKVAVTHHHWESDGYAPYDDPKFGAPPAEELSTTVVV